MVPLSCPLHCGAVPEGTGGVVAQIKQVPANEGLQVFEIPIIAEFWLHAWNNRL